MGNDGLWFRGGECWYLDTSVRGRRIRRSLRTTNRQQALARARQLVAELERAGPRVLRTERTTFNDLAALIRQDYDRNERKSTGKLVTVLQHLRLTFGKWQAAHIGPDDIADYIDRRKQQGAANGTVNRELAALKRSFHLAVRRKRLSLADIPTIDLLKEAAPRAGFFEREQFEAVRRYLPEPLQAVVTVAYITGWRIKSEILKLQWRQVDFTAETIRLDPGTTKNDDGRLFVMTPELRAVLLDQRQATDALQQAGQLVPLVFHRKGRAIKAFRRAWISACLRAGIPDRIPHDFRRTAVRNLERAGVSRSVAMKMVGHRTESIYRRYAIVSESDLREAARKLAAVEQGARNGSHHAAPDQVSRPAQNQHAFDFDVVAGGPRRRSTDGRTRQ